VGGREYHGVLKTNCRDNIAESASYALRSAVARRFRLFHHVSQFIVLTEFSRQWLMHDVGVEDSTNHSAALHHSLAETASIHAAGAYIGYAGRFHYEKGVHLLIRGRRARRASRALGRQRRIARGDSSGRSGRMRADAGTRDLMAFIAARACWWSQASGTRLSQSVQAKR